MSSRAARLARELALDPQRHGVLVDDALLAAQGGEVELHDALGERAERMARYQERYVALLARLAAQ